MLLLECKDIPPDLLEYFEPVDARASKDVFELATAPFKGAHFAVMPPALARRCILAGCPSRVCVECGDPWVRMTTRKPIITAKESDNLKLQSPATFERGGNQAKYGRVGSVETKTIAHAPTCQCCPLPAQPTPTRPGIVLDPFFGAGTVAVVAIETGRDWLGIDLNPEYVKLAQSRINGAQPALFPT